MIGKQRILIVDDDENIAELISLYLTKECFDTKIVFNGEDALSTFETYEPNLILLDLMLPGIDGYQVCRELRSTSQVPIIMLSAKGEIFDKVLGLDSGADDYVAKPFGMMELLARVKALLRRTEQAESEEVYRLGTLSVNKTRHEVYAAGQEVTLTLKEFDLLCLLLENKGRVLTRDRLLNRIWGYGFDGESRTVDVHIRTLRQKLGECGEYIETVRGVGYKVGGNI
mgnify:CR=1 FL=1